MTAEIHRRWKKTHEGWETLPVGPSETGVRVSVRGEVAVFHRKRMTADAARWLGARMVEAAAIAELLTGGGGRRVTVTSLMDALDEAVEDDRS